MGYLAQPQKLPRALHQKCAPSERVVELKRCSQRVRGTRGCTRDRKAFRPGSMIIRRERPRCASMSINGWTDMVVNGCPTNSKGCEAGGVVGLDRIAMKG